MLIEIFLHSVLSNKSIPKFLQPRSRVFHLSTPKGGEMKDPGNEVEIFVDFAALPLAAVTRCSVGYLYFFNNTRLLLAKSNHQ